MAMELQFSLFTLFSKGHVQELWRDFWKERALADEATGDPFGQAMWSALGAAPTYFCSAEATSVAIHAAPHIPDEWVLEQEMIFTESGFMYFEKPYLLEGSYFPIAAALWFPVRKSEPSDGLKPNEVVFRDDVGNRSIGCIAVILFTVMASDLPPWPNVAFQFLFGEKLGETLPRMNEEFEAAKDRRDLAPDEFQRTTNKVRFIATLFDFMHQKLVVSSDATLSRAARRRHANEPEWLERPYRIVALRRVQHAGASGGEHAEMERAYRWIVRGHWRNQWYSSQQRHKVRWITPYVKGPEDKPLRIPKERVFAVVR